MLRYYRGKKGANDYILCYVRIGTASCNPPFYQLCYIDMHLESPFFRMKKTLKIHSSRFQTVDKVQQLLGFSTFRTVFLI